MQYFSNLYLLFHAETRLFQKITCTVFPLQETRLCLYKPSRLNQSSSSYNDSDSSNSLSSYLLSIDNLRSGSKLFLYIPQYLRPKLPPLRALSSSRSVFSKPFPTTDPINPEPYWIAIWKLCCLRLFGSPWLPLLAGQTQDWWRRETKL